MGTELGCRSREEVASQWRRVRERLYVCVWPRPGRAHCCWQRQVGWYWLSRLIIKRHWQINTWLTRQKPAHSYIRPLAVQIWALIMPDGGRDRCWQDEFAPWERGCCRRALSCAAARVPRHPRNCVSDMRSRSESAPSQIVRGESSECVLACVRATEPTLFLPIWAGPTETAASSLCVLFVLFQNADDNN